MLTRITDSDIPPLALMTYLTILLAHALFVVVVNTGYVRLASGVRLNGYAHAVT